MARIRSVHPGLATDEIYMSMSMAAKAAWPLLWTEADDHGIFEWKPIVLKARLFPADDIKFADILAEYERLGNVLQFEVDGKKLGAIRNFCKFQSPKSPSYKHKITPEVEKYVGVKSSNFSSPTPVLPQDSGNATEKSPQREKEREKEERTETAEPGLPREAARCEGAELEAKLRKAAGWQSEPAPKLAVTGPIEALLEAGASLDRDVLPVVKALAPKCRNRTSWNYFIDAIREAMDTRLGVKSNGQAAPVDDAKWQLWLDIGRLKKEWDVKHWGPIPDTTGCRVPAHLLKPGDGEGWIEWKASA